jgi:hypothetical protein
MKNIMYKTETEIKTITYKDIEEILGFKIDEEIRERIKEFNLKYKTLSKEERDDYILNVFNVLSSDITKSGEHRILEWENGWGENLNLFKNDKNINNLIPKYHGKNRIVRWLGEPVNPITENFDYKIHICFVDAILRHYLKDVEDVFEFGCGPAYHLIRLNNYNNNFKLNGSDWTTSSQKIIKEINETLGLNINPFNFDFFNPNYDIELTEKTGIYTVAALEQVGSNYKSFVDYLISKKPKVCIHMEPIDELLDETKLIDNLSIRYFRKRNYLDGFLPYLISLEKEGKIKILNKQRTYSGSYFIEGHSLIVWKPL